MKSCLIDTHTTSFYVNFPKEKKPNLMVVESEIVTTC